MDIFKNKTILIIGDVMLDSYLYGNVDRISSEAPVPIVDILHNENKLGGAANVAANIKNLGGTPILCSVIGNDTIGQVLLTELNNYNISTEYIIKSNHRITTNKTRIIGNNHQMIRLDNENKSNLNESDNKIFYNHIINIITNKKIDCVLFQDYDKGVLYNTNINMIIQYIRLNSPNIPIIVDPKKNNFLEYKNITLFKPNFKEFKEGVQLKETNRDKLLEIGANELRNKNKIKIIFITLAEDGIFISYEKNNKIINKIIHGVSRNVADVSGCGDSVVAVIAMLIDDIDIEEIGKISNIAGGIVCEEIGVVPINKEKLLSEYK